MAAPAYKYDGAISFLKRDEALAVQIHEALAPLDFFVYSKAQEELAGQDGVGAFRDVFRNQARVSLVLFRPGWAETPWTRVEEAAIRDHCLEVGWEHLMFVRLEKGGEIPRWIPDSYIYLDFKTFGIADLVGATKAKCAKLGVELKPPRAIDRARQVADRQRFNLETKGLMQRSPEPFQEAAHALFDALDESFKELGEGTGWTVKSGRQDFMRFVARLGKVSVALYAQGLYANTCDGSQLVMRLFNGAILVPQEEGTFYIFEEPSVIGDWALELSRTPELGWCWLCDDEPRSIQDTAAFVVEHVVDAQEQQHQAKAQSSRMYGLDDDES